MFYDDELNVSKSLGELMDGLSDLQCRRGVDFRVRGFIKAELFNEAQAAAMCRACFRWLLCGFEAAGTGSDNCRRREA
jgi:anaerobic magnesium-protoporphyrin IX monomethyl ester cyclase